MKELLKLRNSEEDLKADADFAVILGEKDKPFIYKRGDLTIAVNPKETGVSAKLGTDIGTKKTLFVIGEGTLEDGTVKLGAQSFVIFK